jgi:hypothetical protein
VAGSLTMLHHPISGLDSPQRTCLDIDWTM